MYSIVFFPDPLCYLLVESICRISNLTLNPSSCRFVPVSLLMFGRILGPFILQLIIRVMESMNFRDVRLS